MFHLLNNLFFIFQLPYSMGDSEGPDWLLSSARTLWRKSHFGFSGFRRAEISNSKMDHLQNAEAFNSELHNRFKN